MNHQTTQMHYSRRMLGAVLANRKIAVCVGIAMLLTACGSSKPGASDIEPYVIDQLGQCQLWTISDVRKTDGIEDGATYRVDFTAKLTLKDTPEQALANYGKHQMDPSYVGCHLYISRLITVTETMSLAKQYEVTGAGILIKSEQGWRLRGELQSGFQPKT